MTGSTVPTKADLRARAIAARLAMTPTSREIAGTAIARFVLGLPEVISASSVAAYLSFGTEPATENLIEALRSSGVRVIVPVVRSDFDLDWAEYVGISTITQKPPGLPKPSGPLLGVHAVADVDVVLIPALSVDERGARLGRGRGCYDRALARVSPARPVLALLYDHECPVAVPTEPHDRPVTAVVLPRGVLRFA